MYRKLSVFAVMLAVATVATLLMSPTTASATRGGEGGRGDGPVIYVTSQGLVYDSIVTADPLPFDGPFQKLEMGGPTGLQTEFGLGDPEYLGGRWWVDGNGNGVMDPPDPDDPDSDHYFSCPLLGPGRAP